MRHILRLLAALSLIAASLGAPAARAQSTPQEYTVNGLAGEPDTIDPNRSSFNNEAEVVRQVFEPLYRFDRNLVPQPAAATGYDLSPDGLTWTFHLRPDGKWSDGQPVTARDFVYSWRRILDPNLAAEYASFFVDAGIVGADLYNAGKAGPEAVGVSAPDDSTFVVQLKAPFGPFLDIAALWVGVPLRQDIVDANPDGWTQDPNTYVGNGPFRMTEWVHQDHISLGPNPQYHGPGPLLQKVTFLMVTDSVADFAAYVNGERDEAGVPDAQVKAVLADPSLSQEVQRISRLVTFWLDVNVKGKPPLNDPVFRRALNKAIDRDAMIRDIANGVGRPATSLIPPGMPGFEQDAGKDLAFDPQGAKDLLRQAGFADGSSVPQLTLKYADSTANQRRAEFIQAQLKQNLGINLNLQVMEAKAFVQAFKAKDFDLAFSGWGADYPDPQDWFAANFGCNGGNNKTQYCNPTFDQLVARADTTSNLGDRLPMYSQAQALLLQDAPVVFLFNEESLFLTKPWVQGLTPTGMDDFSPGDLFLDQVSIAPH